MFISLISPNVKRVEHKGSVVILVLAIAVNREMMVLTVVLKQWCRLP
jgi:hypothetical protein